MVNAYLKIVKLDLFDGCYGLFIGMGNIAVCDGWMLENRDLELFDISEEEVRDQLLADGLVLFKDPNSSNRRTSTTSTTSTSGSAATGKSSRIKSKLKIQQNQKISMKLVVSYL